MRYFLLFFLLESVAAGCIPVCTAVGGIVNVIEDGVEGFLSKEISEESFYLAMRRFLNLSDAERLEMKRNCIRRSDLFTISRCAKEYLNYYEELTLRLR